MQSNHLRRSTIRYFSALLALFLVAPLHAEPTPGEFLFPDHLTRPDSLYATVLVGCGMPIPDPTRHAQLQQRLIDNRIAWEVDIFLKEDADAICFSAAPPPVTYAIELGPIFAPSEYAQVTRRVWVAPANGGNPQLQSEQVDLRGLQATPDVTISGLWWTPSVPGELTSLTLAGHRGASTGDAFLSTQLFDTTGRLVALTAIGRFDGATFVADALRSSRPDPDETAVEVEVSGTLTLQYLGCGKARLAFESTVADFASTERDIELVSRPSGLGRCDIDAPLLLPTDVLFSASATR